MITKNTVWLDKKTGQEVLVLRVSGFRLTYQENGSLKTTSQTDFLDRFYNDKALLDERMSDGQENVAVMLGGL